MRLTDYIDSSRVWVMDAPEGRDATLGMLCQRVAVAAGGPSGDELLRAVLDREAKGSTATPLHVALPHAMLANIDKSFVAVARLNGAVDFAGEHGKDIDLIFMLVGPANKAWEHVRLLARVARICHAPGALNNMRSAESPEDLYQCLVKEDARHV